MAKADKGSRNEKVSKTRRLAKAPTRGASEGARQVEGSLGRRAQEARRADAQGGEEPRKAHERGPNVDAGLPARAAEPVVR